MQTKSVELLAGCILLIIRLKLNELPKFQGGIGGGGEPRTIEMEARDTKKYMHSDFGYRIQ